jgi:hypothetical protein
MPSANIVEDESDYDLNNDRQVLANIRKERAESWQLGFGSKDNSREEETKSKNSNTSQPKRYNIAVSHANHFGGDEDQVSKPHPTASD